MPDVSICDRVLASLARKDDRSRVERAERIEWLSPRDTTPPSFMGRAETLQLLREARSVFVDSHFAATLVVAVSSIEHHLVEELQLLAICNGSPTFAEAVRLAETHKVFPADWLVRAKRLSLRRNPFAHLKPEDHPHALGARIVAEKRHPDDILEADARDAIELMYDFFARTLREANL